MRRAWSVACAAALAIACGERNGSSTSAGDPAAGFGGTAPAGAPTHDPRVYPAREVPGAAWAVPLRDVAAVLGPIASPCGDLFWIEYRSGGASELVSRSAAGVERFRVRIAETSLPPALVGDAVVTASGARVTAFRVEDGALAWSRDVGPDLLVGAVSATIDALAAGGDLVYVAARGEPPGPMENSFAAMTLAYDAATGTPRGAQPCGGSQDVSVDGSGSVFTVSWAGYVFQFHASLGYVTSWPPSWWPLSSGMRIVAAHDRYVAVTGGVDLPQLEVYGPANGVVAAYRPGVMFAGGVLADGWMWVKEMGDDYGNGFSDLVGLALGRLEPAWRVPVSPAAGAPVRNAACGSLLQAEPLGRSEGLILREWSPAGEHLGRRLLAAPGYPLDPEITVAGALVVAQARDDSDPTARRVAYLVAFPLDGGR